MIDVRMKGFARRARVSEAQALIEQRVQPLSIERVPYTSALHRALAEEVVADRNVPPHPKSAMDGYAVRAADLPGRLRVIGEITAAEQLEGTVGEGEAVRIMTGARVPEGADTVIRVEDATQDGREVEIGVSPPAGHHVLAIGEDLTAGRPVLPAGRRLRPQDVSMLISVNALEVAVRRRPRVRIVPTGHELVRPGRPASASEVPESNSVMLQGLAQRDGADPIAHPIVGDDPDLLRRALLEPGADLIVMIGGSSVGKEDFGPVVLRELGELPIHGVHAKPASPTGIGFLGSIPVVLAPGYPVAAYIAWDLFARPIVQRMLGLPVALPYATARGRLAKPLSKPAEQTLIARVVLAPSSRGLPMVSVLPGGAALLSTLTRADGFLYGAEGVTEIPAGAEVEVHLYG